MYKMSRSPSPVRSTSPRQVVDSWERSSSPEGRDSMHYHGRRSRRETNHLTPDHRPRSISPSHDSSWNRTFRPLQQAPWTIQDPRSSSMQSLLPLQSAGSSKRTLLLIYIHGFMGNETSFKSFPAHVHNVLSVTLAESHVIHTKIYPRYRSRKSIERARDDFSNWLTPHESPHTDIMLLGHSLGGILATEVALLPSYSTQNPNSRVHRILGVIAYDTPFLGLHPSVVSTGITSLFQSNANSPAKGQASEGGSNTAEPGPLLSRNTFSRVPNDPNYNPAFANDTHITQRKGFERLIYFVQKHSDDLARASTNYVTSYLEFGGCLADYPGLKRRYNALRASEAADELNRPTDEHGRALHRIRFVNYYTASTGRLKPPNTPEAREMESKVQHLDLSSQTNADELDKIDSAPPATPRFSLEEHRSDGTMTIHKPASVESSDVVDRGISSPSSSHRTSSEFARPAEPACTAEGKLSRLSPGLQSSSIEDASDLPPVMPLDDPPSSFDAAGYNDKTQLESARKEHAKLVKGYKQHKKDYEKQLRERHKAVQKRQKAADKVTRQAMKAADKARSVEESQKLKRAATLNPEVYDRQIAKDAEEREAGFRTEQQISQIKKQRDRKFCLLPSKDPQTCERDRTWIRVYMHGVDEVTAHTSLFIPEGTTYEKLVGDTAQRIETWVRDEQSLRVALES